MTKFFIFCFSIGFALGWLGDYCHPDEPFILDGMQAYCAPAVPFIDDQKHSAGCVKP